MKSYAIIENNVVTNVVIAEDAFAKSQNWIEIAGDVSIGWEYVNGVFTNIKNEVELQKSKIKTDIAALETSVTPRRQREAILGTDNGWLADIEVQIQELRGQL